MIAFSQPTQAAWREVFFIAAAVYMVGATIYLVFASGVRQPWDDKRLINENRSRRRTQDASAENGANGVDKNNGMFGVANGTFDDISKH